MPERLLNDCALPGTHHTRAGGVEACYVWHAQARTVHGQLTFRPDAEGLPGYVHGGALSAVADEAMGLACWCEGFCAPGAQVNTTFLHPVRVGDRGVIQATLGEVQGRKLLCQAEILVGDVLVARTTGVFVSIPLDDPAPFAEWPGVTRFR